MTEIGNCYEKEVLENFQEQLALIRDEEKFKKQHGFTLEKYLENRREFSTICRTHADHMQEFAKGSGIARTVGGSVTIVSGGLAILGVILAPFTVGASLGLTISGITGGILGSGTSIGASLAKDYNIVQDQKKIRAALSELEAEDEVVVKLLASIRKSIQKIREIRTFIEVEIGKRSNQAPVLWIALERMVKNGVDLGNAIVRIASIADDVVLASAETAGRVGVAAGSTTAKVLSGTFAGVGIVFGAYDIYKGVKDIGGSEIAEKYREFAKEYDDETESTAQFIHRFQTAIV